MIEEQAQGNLLGQRSNTMKSSTDKRMAQREAARLNQIETTKKVWIVRSEVVNFNLKHVVRTQAGA
jgi:hypothetical protein